MLPEFFFNFGTLKWHFQRFGVLVMLYIVQCADLKSIFNHVRNPLQNKVVQVG
jgi:hypothetical protein